MLQTLLNTIIRFIIKPSEAWRGINKDHMTKEGFVKIALPFMFLHSLVNMLMHIINEGLSSETIYSTLVIGIGTLTGTLLAIIFSASLLKALLKNEKVLVSAPIVISILSYAAIPFFIAAILASIFSAMAFIHLFGFYSFYILATGIKELLDVPEDKRGNLIILSSLLIIAVFSIVTVVNNAVVGSMIR